MNHSSGDAGNNDLYPHSFGNSRMPQYDFDLGSINELLMAADAIYSFDSHWDGFTQFARKVAPQYLITGSVCSWYDLSSVIKLVDSERESSNPTMNPLLIESASRKRAHDLSRLFAFWAHEHQATFISYDCVRDGQIRGVLTPDNSNAELMINAHQIRSYASAFSSVTELADKKFRTQVLAGRNRRSNIESITIGSLLEIAAGKE